MMQKDLLQDILLTEVELLMLTNLFCFLLLLFFFSFLFLGGAVYM